MIVLDATSFALLVSPGAKAPTDPATGKTVTNIEERFAYFEAEAHRSGETILIPTPTLAEVLVGVGDAAPAVLERISRSSRFKIADFDTMAAVELAAMTREAIRAGNKKSGSTASWQKVKIDRQIIAIAKARGATRIYSDDEGVVSFASLAGLEVVRTWEMPLPAVPPQRQFDFDPSADSEPS